MPEQDPIPAFPSDGDDASDEDAPDAAPRRPSTRTRKGAAPPVLVEVRRGQTTESRHRGHVVCVDAESGNVLWDRSIPAKQPEQRYEGIGIPTADHDGLGRRFFRASNAVAHEIAGTITSSPRWSGR